MKKQVLVSLILAASMVSTANAAGTKKSAKKAAPAAATTAATPAATTEVAANTEASSNTTSAKASDLQKKDEKVSGDIDQEITNAKMRAESGSKSKWSVSVDMSYMGGNLEKPFGAVRPNYSGEPSTNDVTYIDGTVAIAYRLNPKHRLNFGTGVSLYTPFQVTDETISRSVENGGATDVSTPYISWKTAGRIGETQNSLSVTYSHSTSDFDRNVAKTIGAVGLSHVILFDIEGSNWQPGFSTSIGNQFFSETNARNYDYYIGFYPFVEYAFNDRYSFRTVFRPFDFRHMTQEDNFTFRRSMYTQSVGLGIAVTRDIYLYPNMQFAPENLKPELTNVGMSTTLNIF